MSKTNIFPPQKYHVLKESARGAIRGALNKGISHEALLRVVETIRQNIDEKGGALNRIFTTNDFTTNEINFANEIISTIRGLTTHLTDKREQMSFRNSLLNTLMEAARENLENKNEDKKFSFIHVNSQNGAIFLDFILSKIRENDQLLSHHLCVDPGALRSLVGRVEGNTYLQTITSKIIEKDAAKKLTPKEAFLMAVNLPNKSPSDMNKEEAQSFFANLAEKTGEKNLIETIRKYPTISELGFRFTAEEIVDVCDTVKDQSTSCSKEEEKKSDTNNHSLCPREEAERDAAKVPPKIVRPISTLQPTNIKWLFDVLKTQSNNQH